MIRFVNRDGFEKWFDGVDATLPWIHFSFAQDCGESRRFARRMYRHDDGHIETFYQEMPVIEDPKLGRYGPHDAFTFKDNAERLWRDIIRMRDEFTRIAK